MRNVAFAIIGGLVAALCFSAFRQGDANGMILFWIASLPLFLVGLGVGIVEAVIAAMVGAAAASWTTGVAGAAGFLAVTALPAAILTLLTLGRFGKSAYQLSAGILAMALGGIGIAGFLIAVLAMRHHPGGLQAAVAEMLDSAFRHMGDGGRNQEQALKSFMPTARLAFWFPGVIATVWMGVTMINGVVAQGLLARFGRNRRSLPGMAAIDLPRWSFLIFAAALALAIWGKGEAAFIGLNVAIISALPLGLGGLAVIHCLAARVASTGMILGLFYATSFLLAWSVPLVVVLGVIEQWVGLKRRIAKPARGEV
jgi:uncharacterized protein YybS (DUF2232 family)